MKTTTADTITPSTVSEASDAIATAAQGMALLSEDIEEGSTTPAAAAAEYNRILSTLGDVAPHSRLQFQPGYLATVIDPSAAHDILMEQTAAAIFAAAEAGLRLDIPIDTLSDLTAWLGYETFDETAEHFACNLTRKVTFASE